MTLAELKEALQAADPAAVLVSGPLLARLLRQVRKLPGQYLTVPHAKSLVIDRHVLFQHTEQDELGLESDRLLPPTVILLARPTAQDLADLGREALLLRYWRRLFHANVHLHLEDKFPLGAFRAADLRARIEQIGQVEFEEVRNVLRQERYLFPDADEREVYIEFAAVYLELRQFAPPLRGVYFPAVRDFERIDQVLAQDVDALALFVSTRPEGAPEPVVQSDSSSDAPKDAFWKLMRKADQASQAGNTVKAAVLRAQAAGVAPAAQILGTRADALAELRRLTNRLGAALRLTDPEAQKWAQTLPALLERAVQGHVSVEARLLYELQKVCVAHERDVYALDFMEWLLSAGKRPIRRPLPSQRYVRIVTHLRRATARLKMARVSDAELQQLTQLFQTALHRSELRLQARFRPVLTDAFHDVGLRPNNPPERTAFHKMIEELLDRITANGFLTYSDLRDAVSRNQLKLPDVAGPEEFVRGDPLLRLDRRLGTALDGVYHPSEFYLRLLQRLTSLNFGTRLGRFLTRYVTLPFGAALLTLEGVEKILWATPLKDHVPVLGPLSGLIAYLIAPPDAKPPFPVLSTVLFVLLGLLFFGLIHVASFRQSVQRAGKRLVKGTRQFLVRVPPRLLMLPAFRKAWRSWPVQLFVSYLFWPLLTCFLLWWLLPEIFDPPLQGLGVFAAVALFINSRLGRAAGETGARGLAQLYEWAKAGLVQNLYRFTVRVFKQVVDWVDFLLFLVEEQLRSQSGDSRLSIAVRTVLGVFWFPVAYLARLYTVVLIEPGINPVKLPVSILAAKFTTPLIPILTPLLAAPLKPVVGDWLAYGIAVVTLWLSPDAFGFLFWETKENWRLYRANRPDRLKPVMIGPHGEHLLQLLKPGFHSGTLPKLYARLRTAERTAYETGSWRGARAYRHQLEEVQNAIRHFVDRELLNLLHQSPGWRDHPLRVGRVGSASNRVTIELSHEDYPNDPPRLAFEEQAGWLVADLQETGWLNRLDPGQSRAMTRALAGLYKLAGIALVREQVRAQLPPETLAYEIGERNLTFWLGPPPGTPVLYGLDEKRGQLRPHAADGTVCELLPVLPADKLIFGRAPLYWDQWVAAWQHDQEGKEDRPLFPSLIGPLPAPPPPPAELTPVPAEAQAALQPLLAPADGAAPPPALESGHRETLEGRPDPLFGILPYPFGRYRILKRLGRGGMGSVYLAVDTTLDRQVALKVAAPKHGAGSEETARFLREARAAAALQHEGICRVLDYGAVNGTPFLTMEHIEGRPLTTLLENGRPMDERRAASVVHQVSLALKAAHRQGVIHRDLKPANIMITTEGEPKVVDFGLARRTHDETLTGHGELLGTPAYMSPEQISGQPVTPATDVYSLGVILYELVTGRLPFEGTLSQLVYRIVHQEPDPPSLHRPDIDPHLEAICRKAMAKAPADRYATMAELADALGKYLNGVAAEY